MSKVLLIQSHYGPPSGLFSLAVAKGQGTIRLDTELTEQDFLTASGVITTVYLDQVGFMTWATSLQELLNRGGRWFFNGHLLRSPLPECAPYQPIIGAKRADFVLKKMTPHPIFEGINMADLEENKGVAGFYGRGANPMPQGARAVTGLGPREIPVDWHWDRPAGGAVFSHAGNDLGDIGGPNLVQEHLAPRIIDWALGKI